MEYMVTAQTEWYEEVASGVRRIRMPEADVDWMDINLDKAGEDLDAFVPNPEVGQLMLERFSECGRLRVADATLIRMEVPIEFLDTEEELRIAILLSRKGVIVAHRGHEAEMESMVRDIVHQGTANTPLIITCEILDDLLDLVTKPLRRTSHRLDELDDAKINPRDLTSAELDISDLRRDILMIDRQIDPLQTLLRRLLVDASTTFDQNELLALRELSERTSWFQQRSRHQLDHARMLNDQLHIRTADEINNSMYRLSVIATIFLPLSFITGLLGINVGGIPGERDGHAFWVVCVILIGLAVLTFVGLSRAIRKR